MWDNISSEELTRRCSDFSMCQTMNGAALVDDRSGVTFNVELCIPWDAPEAVVDINSAELDSLGSFPDKVGAVRPVKGCSRQSNSARTGQ